MSDITKHIEDYYAIAERDAGRYAAVPVRPAPPTFDAAAWTLVPEFVPAPTQDNPHAMRRQGPLSYRHRDGRLVVGCRDHGCELWDGPTFVAEFADSERGREH